MQNLRIYIYVLPSKNDNDIKPGCELLKHFNSRSQRHLKPKTFNIDSDCCFAKHPPFKVKDTCLSYMTLTPGGWCTSTYPGQLSNLRSKLQSCKSMTVCLDNFKFALNSRPGLLMVVIRSRLTKYAFPHKMKRCQCVRFRMV